MESSRTTTLGQNAVLAEWLQLQLATLVNGVG